MRFASAADAERGFYDAFQNGDLAAMLLVWDDADDIVCVHPMSPSLQGTAAVHESWRMLLANGERMRFTPHVIRRFGDDTLTVHHLYEQIAFGPALAERSVVTATNAYRLTGSGWRMVLHHGSPGRALPADTTERPSGTVH